MSLEPGTLLAAFIVGLLGAVHCVGMCGGIVAALTLGVRKDAGRYGGSMLVFTLAYNTGRILSYATAGALVGGLGWFAVNLTDMHLAQRVLQVLAALFMIALGLYLAGWWRGLRLLERAGGRIWRRLEPLGRRFMPVRTPAHAFVLGLVWGWLPCGLVYSVLIWSLTAGGAVQGASLMMAFGLGTLPNLMLMGSFAAGLSGFVRNRLVQMLAGGAVCAYGVWMLLTV